MQAFDMIRLVSASDPMVLSIASQFVQLQEENPWIRDSDAAVTFTLEACQSTVALADANRPPVDSLGISCSREDRIERERRRWANDKLASLAAATEEDSDAEDDGPARPKFEGWQIG